MTGVSGSGKSTLVHDVLYRQLEGRLRGGHSAKAHLGEPVGSVGSFIGWELLDDVLLVDQSPIGRTPRSNPVTYIRAFDEIRELFAAQPESRMRRYTPATFSFNMPGGRCEECQGAGAVQVEMVFLADVFMPCEVCGGTRFKREVLEVKIRGHSIADVLESRWTKPSCGSGTSQSWDKPSGICSRSVRATSAFGQPATTLRAEKRSDSRSRANWPNRPSAAAANLHPTSRRRDYISTIARAHPGARPPGGRRPHRLVIEHHLDVIKRADWIIDLGPEAGDRGGMVVAQGTPESILEVPASHTARYLRPVLRPSQAPEPFRAVAGI